MKCPACGNELSQMVAGDVVVDVCQGGCGGIWFDIFELKKVDSSETATATLEELIGEKPDLKVDHTRKRVCPRCGDQIMMRRYFSRTRTIQIDECPACGGQWLDAGELAKIHAESRQARQEQASAEENLSRSIYHYVSQAQSRRS